MPYKVVRPFESEDEILKSVAIQMKATTEAVLSCGRVYHAEQGGSV